jgi:hypothetical protein
MKSFWFLVQAAAVGLLLLVGKSPCLTGQVWALKNLAICWHFHTYFRIYSCLYTMSSEQGGKQSSPVSSFLSRTNSGNIYIMNSLNLWEFNSVWEMQLREMINCFVRKIRENKQNNVNWKYFNSAIWKKIAFLKILTPSFPTSVKTSLSSRLAYNFSVY